MGQIETNPISDELLEKWGADPETMRSEWAVLVMHYRTLRDAVAFIEARERGLLAPCQPGPHVYSGDPPRCARCGVHSSDAMNQDAALGDPGEVRAKKKKMLMVSVASEVEESVRADPPIDMGAVYSRVVTALRDRVGKTWTPGDVGDPRFVARTFDLVHELLNVARRVDEREGAGR